MPTLLLRSGLIRSKTPLDDDLTITLQGQYQWLSVELTDIIVKILTIVFVLNQIVGHV